MSLCVKVSLLYFFAVFHTLHGEMYFEREKKGTIRHRCRPDLQSCFPSQLEWAELAEKMTGELVWPDDSNYTAYNYQLSFNTHTYPLVHVVCKTVEDIKNAVKFAKKHNLRVTIKSSGSELWGRSSAHGSFSINLMEMKYIHVNTEATERSEHGEVTVETGVNTGELIQEVEKQNRLVNVGSCPSVSPGGFIAGGGYGLLSPSLGLAVDNVLEIKVVLADGRVATCTQNNTIGVVVHYVLKLYPTTNNFVSVLIRTQLYLNDSDEYIIKKFMDAYDVWVRTAPSSWGGVIGFRRGTLYAILVKLGLRDGNTESELKPFYDFQRTLSHQSHVVSINLGNHTKLGDIIQDDARYASAYRTGALIPPKKHNESLWDFLAQEIMDANNRKIEVVLYLIRLGGKVSEYDVTSSSVHDGFRRAQSHLAFYFKAPTDRLISSIEELERQEKNAAQFAEKIRKFGDGDYFNVGYIPSPNWKLDFWGAHYVDLLVVKIRYDPGNLFSCYHCVGSDRTDFDDMFESSRASATIPEYVSTVLLLIATLIHVY